MNLLKKYIREPVNGLTHGFGALLALVGLGFMLYDSLYDMNRTIAFSIFGVSMVLLYTSSSLYHSVRAQEKTLELLRKLDHSMIYVLIAGSYTPVCVLALESPWKWILLITVWTLAVVGVIKKFLWKAPRWISTLMYLSMGWLAVVMFPALWNSLPGAFLGWIIMGGLAYTIGAIIYGFKKPDPIPEWFGFHEIWHLFVMAGTFSHFWAFYHFLT